MSAHHCFQIAPSYCSACPLSCWGNLVKQSSLSVSEDKWVPTGGGDHLSPRKRWIPFVWRAPLITGTSSAVPLVTALVDGWAALGSSLIIHFSGVLGQHTVVNGYTYEDQWLHVVTRDVASPPLSALSVYQWSHGGMTTKAIGTNMWFVSEMGFLRWLCVPQNLARTFPGHQTLW